MIRATAIASLVVALLLALYLPSAFPPARFLDQLKLDHHAAAELWGADDASRMLERTLAALDSAPRLPGLGGAPASTAGAVDTAVSQEMATVGQRLFDNAYFRSIEALMLLAMFRLGSIGHALSWLLPFIAVALIDGQLSRLRKAREFGRHDPELFALAMMGSIVVVCGTFTAALLPLDMPAWIWPIAPLASGWLMACALACFHHRA